MKQGRSSIPADIIPRFRCQCVLILACTYIRIWIVSNQGHLYGLLQEKMMSGHDSLSKIAAAIEIQRVWRGYCVRYVCTCMYACVFRFLIYILVRGGSRIFKKGSLRLVKGFPLQFTNAHHGCIDKHKMYPQASMMCALKNQLKAYTGNLFCYGLASFMYNFLTRQKLHHQQWRTYRASIMLSCRTTEATPVSLCNSSCITL